MAKRKKWKRTNTDEQNTTQKTMSSTCAPEVQAFATLHRRQPPCYSCYKPNDNSLMRTNGAYPGHM